MGYLKGEINGAVYLGSVKWHNNDENVMMFDNKNARDNFMKETLHKQQGNIIAFNPFQYIDLYGMVKNFEKINYAYIIMDSDFSNTPYCCYVTNIEIISRGNTRLHLELDVFQQYVYDCTFYRSYIERAHVKKSDDIVGKYTLNEPVGGEPNTFKTLGQDDFNWDPKWTLHTTSITNQDQTDYIYGGRSNGYWVSGEFVTVANNSEHLKSMLKGFTKSADDAIQIDWKNILDLIIVGLGVPEASPVNINVDRFYDHTNEISGIYARPTWALNEGMHQIPQNKAPYCDIRLNKSTLANNYKPKNNKLLTSLCNSYQLHNQNGINIALKPEYCTSNTLRLQVQANTFDTSGYKLILGNYSNVFETDYNCPYFASTNAVIDVNSGLNKTINALQGVGGAVQSTVQGATTTSFIGGPTGAIAGGAIGLLSSVPTLVEKLRAQPVKMGSPSGFLNVTPSFHKLIVRQVSPNLEDSIFVDNFLSAYGYNLSEILPVSEYINNRNNYNFIKVTNLNANLWCPDSHYTAFKALFEKGIRIWHNYNNFGNLGVENI